MYNILPVLGIYTVLTVEKKQTAPNGLFLVKTQAKEQNIVNHFFQVKHVVITKLVYLSFVNNLSQRIYTNVDNIIKWNGYASFIIEKTSQFDEFELSKKCDETQRTHKEITLVFMSIGPGVVGLYKEQ